MCDKAIRQLMDHTIADFRRVSSEPDLVPWCLDVVLVFAMKLSMCIDKEPQICRGTVQGQLHWWVLLQGEAMIYDVMAHRFKPNLPESGEYVFKSYEAFDVRTMARCVFEEES